jgi:hypothetical protein
LTFFPARGLVPAVSGTHLRTAVFTIGVLGIVAGGAVAGTQSQRLATERTMQVVSAVPANAELAAEPLQNAVALLNRADDARAAGDHQHAALLEAVALEWAESGRDLVRAARAEADADELAKQAADVEERLVRARVLLEQTVARRGRAKARLDEIERGQSETSPQEAP